MCIDFGITFQPGSQTSGIYAASNNDFYNFTYTYAGAQSYMNSSLLCNSNANALSAAFSADTTRIILTASYKYLIYI